MFGRILTEIALTVVRWPHWIRKAALCFGLILLLAPFSGIIGAKIYQNADNDPDRGGVSVNQAVFDDSYDAPPEYLNQGWSASDSLWFYNTTQGSALLPYDFLLALEQPDGGAAVNRECDRDGKTGRWFLCDNNVDRYRYLPQKATLFNPDALPVGFVKETYQGRDYVGFTCAACHTGQITHQGRAIRIDGGPAMADMVMFLTELTDALMQTRLNPEQENPRYRRFVDRVLDLGNDYDSAAEIDADLEKWSDIRQLYNIVNHSSLEGRAVRYGYARLDAFGRIYNRVIQHAMNRDQIRQKLRAITVRRGGAERRLLSEAEVDKVLSGVGSPDDIILNDVQFWSIIENLRSTEPGYPGLSMPSMFHVRDAFFNPPNAPVSYPFLWDVTRSDFVQWNGLAGNAVLGPLGRNTGEVIGVFAILDWHEDRGIFADLKRFSLSAWLSGQSSKHRVISFKSSVDLFNLQRLEAHLHHLISPRWPFCRRSQTGEYYLPLGRSDVPVDERPCEGSDQKFDRELVDRGELLYAKYCVSCHEIVDRDDWDRRVIGFHLDVKNPQSTDGAMALNSTNYSGGSGNFVDTYQRTEVGSVVMRSESPAVELLSAATRGVVATPDADKWLPRRLVDFVYTLFLSVRDNDIESSIKRGRYRPDTTEGPYNSLQAYRARSLNGIWATAPYLHNGSVPTLYDLLLPAQPRLGICEETRPQAFMVGSREFDPVKVGARSEGYDGFQFQTDIRGNRNTGHEYAACGLSETDRMALIEFLKTL